MRIEKSGILTTVQDLGRYGYRRMGINPSGVMDHCATRLINILVGNVENEAVIEMHFPAARIVFEADAIFALGGADFDADIDGVSIDTWRPILALKGSTLSFGGRSIGHRAYLTLCGGIEQEKCLGSSSTNLSAGFGGVEGRKLTAGDKIRFRRTETKEFELPRVCVSASLRPHYSRFPTIRIVTAAEHDSLSPAGKETLAQQDFSISNASDRMGFRLSGEPISLARPLELLSSAVDFGTIQLLPDGQLIVLMADHQTTGGYPRIAHVISRDLPLLAQLGPGDKVAFHLISHAEAEELAVDFERELRFFRVGCKFQARSWTS
ncbi:MAG: biotin-dependent carboxyltransferase family protein [Pyrinomonadaceae bacterium]